MPWKLMWLWQVVMRMPPWKMQAMHGSNLAAMRAASAEQHRALHQWLLCRPLQAPGPMDGYIVHGAPTHHTQRRPPS